MAVAKKRTRTVPKSGKGTGGRGGSPQVRAPRAPKGKGKPTRKVPKSGKRTGGKGGSPQVRAQGTRGGSPQVKAQGYKGGSPQVKAQGYKGGSPQSARGQGSKGGSPQNARSRNVAHGGVYKGSGFRIADKEKFMKGVRKAAAAKVKQGPSKGRSTYRRG